MMEETNNMMPDTSGASTPLPPIDNIHNPPSDLLVPSSQQPLEPRMPSGDQLDIEMREITAIVAPQNAQPTVAPLRTATPSRQVNGAAETATSMPAKAASHGAPARRYLNEKVTGVLLEGMKRLAAEQPEDPLRVLGEFLLQRSKEME